MYRNWYQSRENGILSQTAVSMLAWALHTAPPAFPGRSREQDTGFSNDHWWPEPPQLGIKRFFNAVAKKVLLCSIQLLPRSGSMRHWPAGLRNPQVVRQTLDGADWIAMFTAVSQQLPCFASKLKRLKMQILKIMCTCVLKTQWEVTFFSF